MSKTRIGHRKDVRQFITSMRAEGWEPTGINGTGHIELTHRNGRRQTIPNSPSDYRSLLNARARMRRIAREPRRK